VIGGGDWGQDRLVPDLARAVAEGRTAVIRNPQAVRPWQHVLEPLAGYITLAEHLIEDAEAYSGSWNFGPAAASFQTVETVVGMMGAYWRGKLKWSTNSESHPHEAAQLALDSTKASIRLRWGSRLKLEDTLRLAVEWYDAFQRKDVDLRRFTESQIAWYAGLAASC
jgi:CDP-glucose 4,6-dehydratase